MLIIKFKTLTASFDNEKTLWTAAADRASQVFVEMLNQHLPVHSVSSVYYEGKGKVNGLDGEAFDAISFLGKRLKVVHYEEDPLPELDKNVVI